MAEIKGFPLKWAPETQRFLRPTKVNFDLVPLAARSQAGRLVGQLGDDAEYVKQPLQHVLEHAKFNRASFDALVASEHPMPGFSRTGWVAGLETLAANYREIPAVLWDTLAVMGLRPNADQEEAIPMLGHLLPHPWSAADAAIHAAAKATGLWSDICHVLQYYSGRYPEHGCACNHVLRALPEGAAFPALPRDRHAEVISQWWGHFLSELALIHVLGFPFALNERTRAYAGGLIAA